jgi:Fe-S-cluster-containing dehydrogenase component
MTAIPQPEQNDQETSDVLYLYHDSERCIGCYSCELHCKMNKNLPIGPRLCRLMEIGPKVRNSSVKMDYHFLPCFHCEKPVCLQVCPTGAIQKRAKDGIVFIEKSLCIGCKCCIAACPWGVPQWNPETGKAVKCDYCMDRVDKGLKPACVTGCLTQCLSFGSVDQASKLLRKRFAESMDVTGKGAGKVTEIL